MSADKRDFFANSEGVVEEREGGFEPPASPFQLVKVSDMIVPVLIEGRLARRVFVTLPLVVEKPVYKTLAQDNLLHYRTFWCRG
jgi:hypothetical protein